MGGSEETCCRTCKEAIIRVDNSLITLNLRKKILISLLQNIRVMAKYYNRITLARMSALLDLPPQVKSDCHKHTADYYFWQPAIVEYNLVVGYNLFDGILSKYMLIDGTFP